MWLQTLFDFLPWMLMIVLLRTTRCNAEYNSTFCEAFRKNAYEQTVMPYFYNDYSVLVERSIFEVGSKTTGDVIHQQLKYSQNKQQATVTQETTDGKFWILLDKNVKGCIFKQDEKECISKKDDCLEPMKEIRFGHNGKIDLGSASQFLGFPPKSTIKKQFFFSNTFIREINATKIGICAYFEDTGETATSALYYMRSEEYSNLEADKNVLLSVFNSRQQPGGFVAKERIDYTDFKYIKSEDLFTEFQVGELQCGSSTTKFKTQAFPEPSLEFKYIRESFVTNSTYRQAYSVASAMEEYSAFYQLQIVIQDKPVNDTNEKETSLEVDDFSGSHQYMCSKTNGSCRVTSLGHSKQISPQRFWSLNNYSATYMGEYSVRDIPCDMWTFDAPENPWVNTISFYLAKKEWLHNQHKDPGSFFPVEAISRGNDSIEYISFYSFQDRPVVRVPYLPECYKTEDILAVRLKILQPYDTVMSSGREKFKDEFRIVIKNITGIVSSMRIGPIKAERSDSSDQETTLYFTILGRFKDSVTSGEDDLYSSDPVTTKEAGEKLKAQVDKGNAEYIFNSDKKKMDFKRGSFAVVGKGYEYLHMADKRGQMSKGFSSGAMAGLAIVMLLAGLAGGIGSVFGYKRYTEGRHLRPSFGMGAMQEHE